MEYEIELKLLTDKSATGIIETNLLPRLNATITQEKSILTNHYFDTPDQQFRKKDMGLRIRGNSQEFEQTLKTRGKTVGGLHQRPEFNVSITKQGALSPQLALFPVSAWPANFNVQAVQADLILLFTTHFTRHTYSIEFATGECIELVSDFGEISCGDKVIPISEIELELKQGAISTVFDLAKQIVKLIPTGIGIDSKAKRGYELLQLLTASQSVESRSFTANPASTDLSLNVQLENNLTILQRMLIEFGEHCTIERAYKIGQVLAQLEGTVKKIGLDVNHSCLSEVEKNVSSISKTWSLNVQSENMANLTSLVRCPDTTQMQLDILQYLLGQSE